LNLSNLITPSFFKNQRAWAVFTWAVFTGICLFTILINYPYIYLVYSPSTNVLIDYGDRENKVFNFFASIKNNWSEWGRPGYEIMLAIYIFKNVITFAIETVLNVTSLILFQRHLANKRKLVVLNANVFALTTMIRNREFTMTNTTQIRTNHKNHVYNKSVGSRNMADLVLVKSITGFVHNIFLTSFTMYYLFYPKVSLTLRILQFCAYFASTVRHAINFHQFYFFNTAFRKEARFLLAKLKLVSAARVLPSNQTNLVQACSNRHFF
jgi:hypothetical protein